MPRAVNRLTGAGRRVPVDYQPTEEEILKPLEGEEQPEREASVESEEATED